MNELMWCSSDLPCLVWCDHRSTAPKLPFCPHFSCHKSQLWLLLMASMLASWLSRVFSRICGILLFLSACACVSNGLTYNKLCASNIFFYFSYWLAQPLIISQHTHRRQHACSNRYDHHIQIKYNLYACVCMWKNCKIFTCLSHRCARTSNTFTNEREHKEWIFLF